MKTEITTAEHVCVCVNVNVRICKVFPNLQI